jgi:hypothetical protein
MKASEIAGCRDAALDSVRKTLAAFPEEKLVRGVVGKLVG